MRIEKVSGNLDGMDVHTIGIYRGENSSFPYYPNVRFLISNLRLNWDEDYLKKTFKIKISSNILYCEKESDLEDFKEELDKVIKNL